MKVLNMGKSHYSLKEHFENKLLEINTALSHDTVNFN